MNDALALFHGKPLLQERLKIKKWDEMTQEDYQELLNSQYTNDYGLTKMMLFNLFII